MKPQRNLVQLGAGVSGVVYDVDDQVVLKTRHIIEPPSTDAPRSDHWRYASDTLINNNMLEDERSILRLLQARPHRHLLEAIDTDQPEGIYLRKCKPLSADMLSAQSR